MTATNNTIFTMRSLRNTLQNQPLTFCTSENYDEAIVALFEELEALDISSLDTTDVNEPPGTSETLVKLMNSCWNLINNYRYLMKTHENLKDQHCRTANDNSGLSNHVKRLKEVVDKRSQLLSVMEERERQLHVKITSLNRDLKREKDENLKLKKQIQSKDSQHAHELRRVQQSGNKLRDQLQKSVGVNVPKVKTTQSAPSEHLKVIQVYQQRIHRLEENNGLMLQEINELRDALAVRARNNNIVRRSTDVNGS